MRPVVRRINELLGKGAFELARLYWEQVQALPALAAPLALADRVSQGER